MKRFWFGLGLACCFLSGFSQETAEDFCQTGYQNQFGLLLTERKEPAAKAVLDKKESDCMISWLDSTFLALAKGKLAELRQDSLSMIQYYQEGVDLARSQTFAVKGKTKRVYHPKASTWARDPAYFLADHYEQQGNCRQALIIWEYALTCPLKGTACGQTWQSWTPERTLKRARLLRCDGKQISAMDCLAPHLFARTWRENHNQAIAQLAWELMTELQGKVDLKSEFDLKLNQLELEITQKDEFPAWQANMSFGGFTFPAFPYPIGYHQVLDSAQQQRVEQKTLIRAKKRIQESAFYALLNS